MMLNWTEHFNHLNSLDKKSELWRYTPMNSLVQFKEIENNSDLKEQIDLPNLPSEISGEVIFYNGKNWSSQCKEVQIAQGFSKNHQSLFEMPLQQKQLLDEDVCYAWYKTLTHEQIIQITGDRNLIILVPHASVHLTLPEINIVLEKNHSSIKIFEIHYGIKSIETYKTNLLSIKISNKTNVTYHRFALHEKLKSINWLQVNNFSQFQTYVWKQKEQFHKEYISIDNKTTHATSEIKYIANVGGKSVLDITTQMNHLSSDTKSHQQFKCLLDDSAKAALTGKITIEKNCPQSVAHFRSKHALLSDKAHIFSQPQLEIHTDDVECAHGSSTGALQEEELFYLISRGIKKEAALKLLQGAFLTDEIHCLISLEEQKFFKELIL